MPAESSPITQTLGPVSATLEADLRQKILSHGLVVWTDPAGLYSGFVKRMLALHGEELPYRLVGFQGSYLELMLTLDGAASGVSRPRLALHMPGLNDTTITATPALELFRAGTRYNKALPTLIDEATAGRVAREAVEAFVASGPLTLEDADRWLASLLREQRSDLDGYLQPLSPSAILDQLLSGRGGLIARLGGPAELQSVLDHLARALGIPADWPGRPRDGAMGREDVAFAALSWALCAEYVSDLRRPPQDALLQPAVTLSGPLIRACCLLTTHLRQHAAASYQRAADEAEAWLTHERAEAKATDLGDIDTFRFEEARVLSAALRALDEDDWGQAAQWARVRLEDGAFWVKQEPSRRSAWLLVAAAARLGVALEEAGVSLSATSFDEALARYTTVGAAADQAHRHLEQRRAALLQFSLPEFDTLRTTLDRMRDVWRLWADHWARDFNQLCRRQGFLPAAPLQQRTLFDEVVRPMTREPGVTALLMVDALRYEMAAELYEGLKDEAATTAHLRVRLAELPTETAVGMNALAPVSVGGRLTPILDGRGVKGFSAGEYRVDSPDTRRRAMQSRVGGQDTPLMSLEEILGRDTTSLKRAIGRSRLLVVHSDKIDKAGESGVGPRVFDDVMRDLRSAWHQLREAGVRRFVFTADHGFLLLDDVALSAARPHGRRTDPRRRYILSPVAADETGEARVALSDLGYEGCEGLHLHFPDSTTVFDIGQRAGHFVHGGNALQERVIPVLTIVHRAPAGTDSVRYRLTAQSAQAVFGMHCLRGRVEVVQGELGFTSAAEVELALRVEDAMGVQVELCDARQGASLAAGIIQAKVGDWFEVFFRLTGPAERRVRITLHPTRGDLDIPEASPAGRFAVTASQIASQPTTSGKDWLSELPEGGIRQLFAHLQAHGSVTEAEAAQMLGGARAVRRFSGSFERHAEKAPFGVRIETIGNIKRYVRE